MCVLYRVRRYSGVSSGNIHHYPNRRQINQCSFGCGKTDRRYVPEPFLSIPYADSAGLLLALLLQQQAITMPYCCYAN